jgi:hypothetical protein
MGKRMALRDRLEELFSTAALHTLETKPVKPGRVHCVQHVSWEINKALGGGNYRARLYIDGHGYKHELREQNTPQAGISYTVDEEIWLIPGESLALDLDQVAASTTAKLHLTGFWQYELEGVS